MILAPFVIPEAYLYHFLLKVHIHCAGSIEKEQYFEQMN